MAIDRLSTNVDKLKSLTAAWILALGSTAACSAVESPYDDTTPACSVTVHKGDTLTEIASRATPDGELRDGIHAITEINGGLNPGRLTPGDTLAMPENMCEYMAENPDDK